MQCLIQSIVPLLLFYSSRVVGLGVLAVFFLFFRRDKGDAGKKIGKIKRRKRRRKFDSLGRNRQDETAKVEIKTFIKMAVHIHSNPVPEPRPAACRSDQGRTDKYRYVPIPNIPAIPTTAKLAGIFLSSPNNCNLTNLTNLPAMLVRPPISGSSSLCIRIPSRFFQLIT